MATYIRKIDDVWLEEDGIVFKRVKKGALKRIPTPLSTLKSNGISDFCSTNPPPATPTAASSKRTANSSETLSTRKEAVNPVFTDVLHGNDCEGLSVKQPLNGEKSATSVSLKGTRNCFETLSARKETVSPSFLKFSQAKGLEGSALIGEKPATTVALKETATSSETLNTRNENGENEDPSHMDASNAPYGEMPAGKQPLIDKVRTAEYPDKEQYFLQPCSVRTEIVRTEFLAAGGLEEIEVGKAHVENQDEKSFPDVQEEGERNQGEAKEGEAKEGEQKEEVESKGESMVKETLGSENNMAKKYPRAEQWRKLFVDACRTALSNFPGKTKEKKAVAVVLTDWIKQVLPLVICSDVGIPCQTSRATTITRKQKELHLLSKKAEMLRHSKEQHEVEIRQYEHWLDQSSWKMDVSENKAVNGVENLDNLHTLDDKLESSASYNLNAVQENLEMQVDKLEAFLDQMNDMCDKAEVLSNDLAKKFHNDSFLSLIRFTPRTLLRAIATEPL